MKRLFFSFPLLLLFATGVAQQLRLQEAVSIALKNSLDIQLVKNNQEINIVNNNIGIAGGLPVATLTGSDNEQSVNIKQKISQKVNGADTSYNIIRNGATSNQLAASAGGSRLSSACLRSVQSSCLTSGRPNRIRNSGVNSMTNCCRT